MTREEIMQLNTDYLNGCESEHKMNELFSYALSQDPCGDAISREAVLDTTICEGISCNECSFNEIDGESGCLLHARIDELPSVTQKPIECDDAISRQAVENITWEEPNYTDALNVLTEVREKVRALSPVRPQEPKTGHWIKSKDGYMRCDQCGSRGSAIKAKFCHHCGAKMVKPQESEDNT